MGRPSSYTQERGDALCGMLADGMSLRSICLRDEMPDKVTVLRWLRNIESFRIQYAHARELQAEHYADELTDIADDSANDFMTIRRGEEEIEVVNHENIQRSRLRVDTRKWIASKLLPKKYGDKVAHTGGDGGPITFQVAKIGEKEPDVTK